MAPLRKNGHILSTRIAPRNRITHTRRVRINAALAC